MNADIRQKILNLLDEHRIMTIATLRPGRLAAGNNGRHANEGLTLYFHCGLTGFAHKPMS